jgi:serine/threonine-protein kinase
VSSDLRDHLQSALGDTYTIERELGGGGMSRVFVATERAFDRQVVLKVLRPEIGEAVSIERFRRETQLAARLQHPHIVPLFGGGEAGGFLYYTMPLVEGESLRARLESERQLPVSDALRLTREVAEALAYAHARGVVHRDIKPENILLSDGHALVTDFGIARAVNPAAGERLTSTGLVIGTPAYMSPEQASGEVNVDGRTDVYSLGCVLYEMLAGEPPFTGPSVQAIISRRFTERAPSVRAARTSLPPEVDGLTSRAMATRPDERFATAAEFAQALERAATRPTSVSGTAHRRRVALVALAVAAAGATVWGMVQARATAAPDSAATTTARTADPTAPPSVAVLYLTNRSADTLDAYLADGITEEITSRLARVAGLRVKSRGTVRRIRSAGIADPAEAGRTLDVQYVVAGDVRRAGDSVHTSIQLVRTTDASEVWTDAYTVPASGLVAIQDSIVEQVVRHATGELSAGDRAALVRRRPPNPRAHDHYLRGIYQLAKRTPVSVASAIGEFQEAGRIDPTMTRALASEGYAYAVFADWGWPHPDGISNDEMVARGLAAADRALRQDSASAEAWLARAHLLFLRHPRTLEGVVPAFERAVTLDSTNAEAQYQYGQALMASGLAGPAVARYRRAIALEPDWASPLMSLGAIVSRSGRFDEGLQWLDSAIAVDPSSSYSFSARSTTHSSAGRASRALEDARSAVRVAAGYRVPPYAAMAIALAASGDTVSARRWADSTVSLVPDTTRLSPTDGLYVAAALVRTGQRDRGLSMLERASPVGAWLWFYMTSPLFDGVRQHPRFVRLSERAKPPGA